MQIWLIISQSVSFMIPLRLHSDFSLLKAMVPVEKYAAVLAERGYQAAALTDFNNAFGWVDFYTQMKKANLKPILGATLSIAEGKAKGQFTFLITTQKAYENLCLILSAYSFGTLTTERLLDKKDDLILCVSPDSASLNAGFLNKWPKENLFFEVHRQSGVNKALEQEIIAAAQKFGGRCVATQPVYYLDHEDHLAHEVLLSIGEGTTLQDEKRPRMPSRDFDLKPRAQMEALFHDVPEWLEASDDILKRVTFEWKMGEYHIPKFTSSESLGATNSKKSVQEQMDEACQEGLKKRLELVRTYTPPEQFKEVEKKYRDRLKEECGMIHRMRFTDYFLVVADFIQWSKQHGIPVGPGRGSGAGSLAAYCLEIVDIDPVRYTLLFERFLNPERVSMPDFDVDFCVENRDKVIEYVRQKYNLTLKEGDRLEEKLKVAQIITFGKMKSKAVIRDVGRVMGIPYQDVDAIAKLIPNVLNITLSQAYEMEAEFAALRARDPKADELLRIAERLEGLNRHASIHAAGVVIADDILTKYIPLYRDADGSIISQFEMKGIEKLGLLKFDFLGLRNLTVIEECLKIVVEQTSQPKIDLLKINYSDPKVMAELASGDTIGLFQLESSGMRDVIRRLKPTCLEDIIAIVALYRPGPLEGGMVDDFILRKAGRRAVEYDAAVLEPILKETYGVFVYQEQVMKTANEMAGFSLGEADLLRRAMGKKIAAEMAKQREKFVEGAVKKGHAEALAQKIFDLMAEFAKYGFNKSHAAAYAMITVQTAYLKTYHPEAFFAALLSSEAEDTEKIGFIIRSAVSAGLEILPPHVNHSMSEFALEEHEGKIKIRYGLSAVKNLGDNVARAIVEKREERGRFKDFQQFFGRAPLELLNKRQAECLIRSGALDGLGATRATLFASMDSLISSAQATERDRVGGQRALFAAKPKIKMVEEWADRIRLNDEKHLLGTYMSGHPLRAYQALLASFKTRSISSLIEGIAPSRDTEVSIAGLVVGVKEIFTKKGSKMAFFSLEDQEDSLEVVMFPDLYEEKGRLLVNDRVLLVKGQVSRESDMTKILARDISDLSQMEFSELHLHLKNPSFVPRLETLAERAQKFPGALKVKVHIPVEREVGGAALKQSHVTVETPYAVQTHPELMTWLAEQFGDGAVTLR